MPSITTINRESVNMSPLPDTPKSQLNFIGELGILQSKRCILLHGRILTDFLTSALIRYNVNLYFCASTSSI